MENQKMSVENAFNIVVGLTRQVKLTYEEHKTLEEAINICLDALNKSQKDNEESSD